MGLTAPAWARSPAAAGVSKGTLYVYFADKSRLFEAIVEEETLEHGQMVFNFDSGRDVSTTLREFGQAYIAMLCRPGGGSAIRTVMAIAERMPDVGRRYYERVLEKTISRLAIYLEDRVKAERSCDRRLPTRGLAIHADVPGVAVPAVYFSGGAPAFGRAHRAGDRQRDTDVPRCLPGEGGLSGTAFKTIPVSNSVPPPTLILMRSGVFVAKDRWPLVQQRPPVVARLDRAIQYSPPSPK